MMLQNLGLMAHAMGIGGFPNFAGHELPWFEALNFRMQQMSTMRYLGAGPIVRTVASMLGRDPTISFPVGLELGDEVLLKPYCPPYYETMEAAVHAVVERKFGDKGVFKEGVSTSAWNHPQMIAKAAPPISKKAIDATVAYTSYIHRNYGRFPAYPAPFRTSVGFQAAHLDLDFYARHYRPDALSESHRTHHAMWHSRA